LNEALHSAEIGLNVMVILDKFDARWIPACGIVGFAEKIF
jgi:hypothetical protein